MKIKFADTVKDVEKSSFVYKYINTDEYIGTISLLYMHEVKKEWRVPRENGKKECILASNYKWLEIFPTDKKYAITAMYNDKNEFVEWYIDIIKDSGIIDNVPYIDDLYLDIVITHNNEVFILDEDELYEALQSNDITMDDYITAQSLCDKIIQKLKKEKNIQDLKQFCNKYFDILYDKLDNI